MSNYSKSVNFAVKDTLQSGDPNKIVSGAEIDTEFNNISSSSTTKIDKVPSAQTDNLAKFTATGAITDSGKVVSDFAPAVDTENRLSNLELDIDTKASKVFSSTEDNVSTLTSAGDIKDSGLSFGNSSGQASLNNGSLNQNLNADKLDGQDGDYYLDSNNFTNVPPALRLISRTQVLSTSSTGTVFSNVSPTTFGGVTPTFVMYFASAYESGIADLRYYSVNSGNSFSPETLVLGGGSDDTDQGSTADIIATSTFVLPYKEDQDFYVRYSGNSSGPPVLYIWVVGFQ